MGKISQYTQVLASKLSDIFICNQEESGTTTTKKCSLEQMGSNICGTQTHSSLETTSKTITGAINENKGRIDDLFYHAGDDVTLTNGVFIGIVGNSAKQLTFWIPVNKVISSDITGATITGNMTIYSTNLSEGITNDSATGTWTLTVRDTGVSCVYALVNALATTNRTAVAVRFSTSGDKLTFTGS